MSDDPCLGGALALPASTSVQQKTCWLWTCPPEPALSCHLCTAAVLVHTDDRSVQPRLLGGKRHQMAL